MKAREVRDVERVMRVFARLLAGDDPAAMMREAEVKKGHKLVPVGSVKWLPKKEWRRDAVVSRAGREVRLVAIMAREPGAGAFRRLLDGIAAAGLKPVVVCPMPTMTSILIRWGWRCREVGDSFDTREDQWRPPLRHTAARRAAFPYIGAQLPAKRPARAGGANRRQDGGK